MMFLVRKLTIVVSLLTREGGYWGTLLGYPSDESYVRRWVSYPPFIPKLKE